MVIMIILAGMSEKKSDILDSLDQQTQLRYREYKVQYFTSLKTDHMLSFKFCFPEQS